MPNRTGLLLFLISVICLSHYASAQQLAPGGAPSPDEVAIRGLVVKYFNAYAKEDLEAIAALWSKDAPGAASRRDLMRRMFTVEDYRFSEPAISRIKIEGAAGSARVAVERDATNVQATTSIRKSSIRADYAFVKENNEWKFWSETPAINSLINALASAKSGAEREALLAGDPELINRELLSLLNNQSDRAYAQNDYSRSLSLLISQRMVAEKLDDRKEVSHTWMNTGIIHFTQKRYQQALDAYQHGLAIEEELGRKPESASYLISIGLAQSALGKPQQAIEYFQRGLTIYEELNEKKEVEQTLENIGAVHYEQGNYAMASEFYQRSLKWLESKSGYANRLLKIAKTEYEQGADQAAIGFYAEAVSRFESAGDKRSIGFALHNIANIYYSQGDYAQAMNYYRRCLAAEKEAGTRLGVASALQGIGLIHSLDGNYALELEAYRENLEIVDSLGDKAAIAAAWQKVGGAHFSLGQMDQALDAYKRALASQVTANGLIDLGVTYATKGEYENALESYRQSKSMFELDNDALGVATVLLNESMISYTQNDYAKTIEQADKAAAIAKQFQDGDLFWQARYRAGKAQYRSEKLDLARQAFIESISTIETLRPSQNRGRQPRFYESKLAPYQAMVDVAISEGKGLEAFDYAERAKARVLTGVLQSAKVWINKTMAPREREQERKFLTDIARLNTQLHREQERQNPNKIRFNDLTERLRRTQKDYAAFLDKLYSLHPQLKTLRGEGKTFDATRAAALLTDTETALLDFVETDENSYLFAFIKVPVRSRSRRPASPLKIYILGVSRPDLYTRVTKFQETIANRSIDADPQARELYDILLKPVEEQIAGRKHLIIAPDSVLWNLPFQALRTGDDHYLIENYAVSYTPSLTSLGAISRLRARPRPRSAASPSLLAFVNPVLSPTTEARLKSIIPGLLSEQARQTPDPQNEVDDLTRLYGERRVAVLTGGGASEERIKAESSKYDLLYLNARGALNETAPLFSFAALSSNLGVKEDGLLEVREIFDLNLKMDLAMMPETELAWPKAGAIRSMTGLTWAWFVAGCPATIASLWRSDKSSDLMIDFHRRVKASWGKESKARAWQATVQQSFSHEEYRHPYFWAGFVLLGDAR